MSSDEEEEENDDDDDEVTEDFTRGSSAVKGGRVTRSRGPIKKEEVIELSD